MLGACELVLHDLGNERRYVFLIPAMASLAALTLIGDRRLLPAEVGTWSRCQGRRSWRRWCWRALYVAWGSLTRQVLMPDIRMSVRVAALGAVVTAGVMLAAWPRLGPALARVGWSRSERRRGARPDRGRRSRPVRPMGGTGERTKNFEASLAVGRLLPPGTLVQGKLANGLALDNQIRPLFIGPGFGNYADRLERPDVAWILTYSHPRLGYEGAVVRDLLDAMPGWTDRGGGPRGRDPRRGRPRRADQKTCPVGPRQIQLDQCGRLTRD